MPKQPAIGLNYPINPAPSTVTFDVEAFDNLLRSQGVSFNHERAMKCPIGIVDPTDTRRPHPHHANCSNGFIYTMAGCITASFLGNANAAQLGEIGLIYGSSVHLSLPRFYDNTTIPTQIAQFDRFYITDSSNLAVPYWQVVTASATGIDRLKFMAVRVTDLMDSRGIRYQEGDFEVRGGQIHWLTQNRPGIDPETGLGVCYTVRYEYTPHWYCSRLINEVRVSQQIDPMTGERKIVRMPQSCILQREHVFLSEDKDPEAPNPDSPRQVAAPADGQFGPR